MKSAENSRKDSFLNTQHTQFLQDNFDLSSERSISANSHFDSILTANYGDYGSGGGRSSGGSKFSRNNRGQRSSGGEGYSGGESESYGGSKSRGRSDRGDYGGSSESSDYGGGSSYGGRGGNSSGGGYRGGGGYSGGGSSYGPDKKRFSEGVSRGRFGRQGKKFQPKYIKYEKYIQKAVPKTMEDYTSENTFADFNLNSDILNTIIKRGYTSPTPIQDKIIGAVMQGEDVIGLANTGTGKTGAFLIPLIHNVLEAKKERKDIQYLIVAPTRELAIQIEQELVKLTDREMWIFSTTCIGGTSMEKQIFRLKKHSHFVIGTPGRIKDLINRNSLRLHSCKGIVLDEVDRMLDMGFLDDITEIVNSVPEPRQILFFSATMDKDVMPIANTFLKTPFKVAIQSETSSQNVEQNIIKFSRESDKFEKLTKALEGVEKALIFVRTKMGAEDLSIDLQRAGISTESIHGDKRLRERQSALRSFKEGHVNVLVATDVAARGIDISDIDYVINYDEPDNYEAYIHRIGRTGRAGKTGNALTFVYGE